jgi:hypothetical protein
VPLLPPQHFVQTINLHLAEVKRILSDATYVAYAKRDLRGSALGDVPVSVVADVAESREEVTDEVRGVLNEQGITTSLSARYALSSPAASYSLS